jgi:hypothetical protein
MIHDHALMIHYEKYGQQYIYRYVNLPYINNVAPDMFRPPIVANFREVFFDGYIA